MNDLGRETPVGIKKIPPPPLQGPPPSLRTWMVVAESTNYCSTRWNPADGEMHMQPASHKIVAKWCTMHVRTMCKLVNSKIDEDCILMYGKEHVLTDR